MRYKLRAETVADIIELRRVLDDAVVSWSDWMMRALDLTLPDVECTFECDLEIEIVRHAIDAVADGHVMAATLTVDHESSDDRAGLQPLGRN